MGNGHHALHQGHSLNQDITITDHKKKYHLHLGSDGNLVIYSSHHFNDQNVVWHSNSANKGHAPYKLTMQEDGNLVIYDKHNHATWASNTNGKGQGPYQVKIQEDANLVVYDSHNHPTWASGVTR